MVDARRTVETPRWFVEPAFSQRLLAAVADSVLLLGIGAAAGVLLRGGGAPRALLPLVSALYVIGAVALTGRTLGKRLFGLRVADLGSGQIPDLRAATLRWLVAMSPSLVGLLAPGIVPLPPGAEVLPSLLPLAIYWGVLSGPLHRGFHDRVAGTVVTAGPGER